MCLFSILLVMKCTVENTAKLCVSKEKKNWKNKHFINLSNHFYPSLISQKWLCAIAVSQGEQRELQPLKRRSRRTTEKTGKDGENQRRARQCGTWKAGKLDKYTNSAVWDTTMPHNWHVWLKQYVFLLNCFWFKVSCIIFFCFILEKVWILLCVVLVFDCFHFS